MKHLRRSARASFTLLELLIVIAVIMLLLSIAVGVYFKSSGLADQLAARSDISQLSAAMDKFKAGEKGGKNYPPSRLKLAYNLDSTSYPFRNVRDTLDYDSVQFLTSAFGSRILE